MPLLPELQAATFPAFRRPRLASPLLLVVLCAMVACEHSAGSSAEPPPTAKADRARPSPRPPSRAPRTKPPTVQVRPGTWGQKVRLLADRQSLGRQLAKQGVQPHPRSMALVARIGKGLGWPTFRYYSLGASGFEYSPKRFYPASTVKLVAAVGALMTLGKYGFTGAAMIRIQHGESLIERPVYRMLKDAVQHSSNSAYDRLALVAGFDELNRDYLGPHRGLPDMAIQNSFYGFNIRDSPPVRLQERGRSKWIRRRKGSYVNPRCPRDKNCVNLLGLQEILRRVMLHNELPPTHRLGIGAADITRLKSYLRRHRSRISDHLEKALGHKVKVWNTVGWVAKYDYLENALTVDQQTGDRYLLIVSIPMPESALHAPRVEMRLGRFGAAILRALRSAPSTGPALQPNAGPPMTVRAAVVNGGRHLQLRVRASDAAGADDIHLWLGHVRLGRPRAEPPTGATRQWVWELPVPRGGKHVLVVQSTRGSKPLGYSSHVLEVSAPAAL